MSEKNKNLKEQKALIDGINKAEAERLLKLAEIEDNYSDLNDGSGNLPG